MHHYSSEEHLKFSKTAEFGCKILKNTGNIALLMWTLLPLISS